MSFRIPSQLALQTLFYSLWKKSSTNSVHIALKKVCLAPATGSIKAGPTCRFSFSWLSVPLVNDLPQFFGPERHLDVCHTQRICHSGGNCRSRAHRTRLTNSLHTQWVDGRWGHCMVKLEGWYYWGERQRVIHEGCREQWPILAQGNTCAD